MATVFASQSEGSVIALSFGNAAPATFRVEGLQSENLIVTTFRIDQSANAQFSPTLQDSIYVYSFGDKMGQLVIGGVAFHKTCKSQSPFTGMKDIIQYYNDNSISQNVKPVFLSFGAFSIRCFLTGYNFSSMDPKLNLVQFQLVFAIPARVSGDKRGSSPSSSSALTT